MTDTEDEQEMRRSLVRSFEEARDEGRSGPIMVQNQDERLTTATAVVRVSSDVDVDEKKQDKILQNFTRMSILFSLNHGCVVACLTLATARLGSLGAWQSGLLYMSYTLSALLGSTSLVQYYGSRTSMMIGMALYALYVGCFLLALRIPPHARTVAYAGALLGGSGAGCLWTAQGAYFSHAAEAYDKVSAKLAAESENPTGEEDSSSLSWWDQYSYLWGSCFSCPSSGALLKRSKQSQSTGTTKLAGIFAFWYLTAEVAMRLLSSVVLEWHLATWEGIFTIYTILTIVSAVSMCTIEDYQDGNSSWRRRRQRRNSDETVNEELAMDAATTTNSFERRDSVPSHHHHTNQWWHKSTTTLRLLIYDSKMKYLVGLNAVFGLASGFVNTYINGEVVSVVLQDPDSKYLGVLSSYTSAVAAVMSLVFAKIALRTGRGFILIVGSLAFAGVVLPFLFQPNIQTFRDSSGTIAWTVLLMVYGLMGIGRATFEGTLKATFADYFPYEKEGAFANIILQNGFFTSLSYVLTFFLPCNKQGDYCVEYKDGSTQFILVFEILVLSAAAAAILGYLQAYRIHQREQYLTRIQERDEEDPTLQESYRSLESNTN